MKILHVANFSWFKNAPVYYAIDRKISNGLIRNYHFVYDFSYRDIARHFSWLKRKKLGKKNKEKLTIQVCVKEHISMYQEVTKDKMW